MKKICLILNDSNTKGANGAFIEFIDSLDRSRFNPYVIMPSTGLMVRELEARNIPFKIFYYKWWMHEDGLPKWKKIVRLVVNFIALPIVCYQIKKWQCSVIYTNTITISVGLFSAIILKKIHIFHIHEFGYKDHKLIFDFGKIASLWIANKFTRYFICVSCAVAEEFSQFIKKSKIKVVYQPVTISDKISNLEPSIKKHKFQCVIVGRLFEGKGQIDAIRAMDILVKKGYLDIGLWIVGGGEEKYEKYLKKVVRENNIEEFVTFFGYLDNPYSLIKEANIVLMCSRFEGFGRVTIESMLLGKLVIGARSGATIELIKDEFNGFFYTPGNSEDLARKIEFCYENPFLTHQAGINARKLVHQRFNQKHYAEEITRFF